MNEFAAGIILFNPDINRLKKNIEAIFSQVEKVYCYDNGMNNRDEIHTLLKNYSNIILLGEGKNEGISIALNSIMIKAKDDGFNWLLALDQDSVCATNMIESFAQYTNQESIGILCPLVIDRRRPTFEIPKGEVTEVSFCITSGSCFNLNIAGQLSGMDEYLFVGLVDDDYCYRLKLNGFKILQINTVVLDHELGNLKKSRFADFFLLLGKKTNSRTLNALSYKRKVSPMRVYYATRNILYLEYKFSKHPTYKFSRKFAIKNGISNVVRGEKKIQIFKAFCKGLSDGKKNIYDDELLNGSNYIKQ